jgi:hypothetical protein
LRRKDDWDLIPVRFVFRHGSQGDIGRNFDFALKWRRVDVKNLDNLPDTIRSVIEEQEGVLV